MPSLVLEGGTFRPIFSSGIMDALLEQDIMFPYCIGVSAGISNGSSYISRQRGRNLDIAMKYRNDKRYIGARNLRKCKSIFGLDFVFGELPKTLVPFDMDTFLQYEGEFIVGVTNAETAEIEYKYGKDIDENYTMLRATCALPIYFPCIELDGKKYYDGGLCDPIPIRKAILDGNEKHLIILTRPKGYIKTANKMTHLTARIIKRKYPKLAEVILTRHNDYNETVKFCEQLEKEGKAIILRPSKPIDSFERDTNKLKQAYQEGYDLALSRITEIRELFNNRNMYQK